VTLKFGKKQGKPIYKYELTPKDDRFLLIFLEGEEGFEERRTDFLDLDGASKLFYDYYRKKDYKVEVNNVSQK